MLVRLAWSQKHIPLPIEMASLLASGVGREKEKRHDVSDHGAGAASGSQVLPILGVDEVTDEV